MDVLSEPHSPFSKSKLRVAVKPGKWIAKIALLLMLVIVANIQSASPQSRVGRHQGPQPENPYLSGPAPGFTYNPETSTSPPAPPNSRLFPGAVDPNKAPQSEALPAVPGPAADGDDFYTRACLRRSAASFASASAASRYTCIYEGDNRRRVAPPATNHPANYFGLISAMLMAGIASYLRRTFGARLFGKASSYDRFKALKDQIIWRENILKESRNLPGDSAQGLFSERLKAADFELTNATTKAERRVASDQIKYINKLKQTDTAQRAVLLGREELRHSLIEKMPLKDAKQGAWRSFHMELKAGGKFLDEEIGTLSDLPGKIGIRNWIARTLRLAWPVVLYYAVFLTVGSTINPTLNKLGSFVGFGNAAEIIRPNNYELVLQGTALGGLAHSETRGAAIALAWWYGRQTNMNGWEAFATTVVLTAGSVVAFVRTGNQAWLQYGAGGSLVTYLGGRLTNAFFYDVDRTLEYEIHANDLLAKHGLDFSEAAFDEDVAAFKQLGDADIFELSYLFDNYLYRYPLLAYKFETTKGSFNVSRPPKPNRLLMYRAQVVLAYAQGEALLDQGLTASQALRLDRLAANYATSPDGLPDQITDSETDNEKHQEAWRLAPGPDLHLDIGGRAASAFLAAVRNADELKGELLSTQGKDPNVQEKIAAVEQERRKILKRVDEILGDADRRTGFVRALNRISGLSSWLPGSFKYRDTDYDVVGFWRAKIYEFARTTAAIQKVANREQQRLVDITNAMERNQNVAADVPPPAANQIEKLTTAYKYEKKYVAKLYRDLAFMRLAEVTGKAIGDPSGASQQLDDARRDLMTSASFDSNGDYRQLCGVIYKQVLDNLVERKIVAANTFDLSCGAD
jgi:hypothetical protein